MKRSFGLLLVISAACAQASVLLLQSDGSTSVSAFNPSSCSTQNLSTCEWDGALVNDYADQTNYAIPQSNLLVSSNSSAPPAPPSVTLWGGTDDGIENAGAWISYENSGWNFGPSGTIGPISNPPDAHCGYNAAPSVACLPTADFFEQFTDNSQDLLLSLAIFADDDVAVYLNGVEIIKPSFTAAPNGVCDTPGTGLNGVTVLSPAIPPTLPGSGQSLCTVGEQIVDVPINSGTNILEFESYQMMGSTYGILWNGEVTGVNTPEPVPFALLGAGLVALGALKRKRLL